MTSAASTGKRTISNKEVEGTNVYAADGSQLGRIGELIIERVSGQVVYAIIDFGGFFGAGKHHYPLPWVALKYDTELEGYKTDVTKDQVSKAPDFDPDSFEDRDWETRTHVNYEIRPYWESKASK